MIRLLTGDCLEILPTLEAGSINMIWTDPPYGHSNGDGDLAASRVGVRGGRQAPMATIANDMAEQWESLITQFFTEADRVMKPDCCCCCCCCGGGPDPAFAKMALWMDRTLEFFHAVIWDKSARGNGLGWRYRRNYEFVMIAKRKTGRLAWADNSVAVPNIIRTRPVANSLHPTTKPVELVRSFIEWHTRPGDTILDPFMGSGTTGVACALTGRSFIGIEIDPAYVAIAERRIADALQQPRLFDDTAMQRQRVTQDAPLFAEVR